MIFRSYMCLPEGMFCSTAALGWSTSVFNKMWMDVFLSVAIPKVHVHMAMENPAVVDDFPIEMAHLKWISKRAMCDYQRLHVICWQSCRSLPIAELQLPPQPAGRNKFPATRWEQSRLAGWQPTLLGCTRSAVPNHLEPNAFQLPIVASDLFLAKNNF